MSRKMVVPIFLISAFAFAGPAEYERAQSDYDSGNYREALEAYLSNPGSNPRESAHYHYNLGNLYYRLKEYGKALAHYEKAKRLAPFDGDVGHNLELTRARVRDVSERGLDPASNTLQALGDQNGLKITIGVLSLVSLISLLIALKSLWKTRDWKQIPQIPSGIVAFSTLGLSFLLMSVQFYSQKTPLAVATTRQIIRSGPGDHFLELEGLSEGVKVRVLDQRASVSEGNSNSNTIWQQIRFAPDAIGWVRKSGLLILE